MLQHFADVHDIDLMCDWNEMVFAQKDVPFSCMATELTLPDTSSTVYGRARLVGGST